MTATIADITRANIKRGKKINIFFRTHLVYHRMAPTIAHTTKRQRDKKKNYLFQNPSGLSKDGSHHSSDHQGQEREGQENNLSH